MKLKFTGMLAAALIAAAGPAKAETTFNFSSWIPLSHGLNTNLYIPWAKAVEKASDGEVVIRFLPKAVAAPRAHLDAVRTGQADIAFATHSYSPEQFAAYQFTDFPFLGDSAAITSVALQRTHEKFFVGANLYDQVHLIGMNTLGPGTVYHTKKSIMSPDDVKGQKFRTGGDTTKRLVEGMGGVAVTQPITKAYELLSSGVVDGHVGHWEQMVGFNLAEVLAFGTEIPGGINSGSMYLVVNQAKYDALSDKGKAAFDMYSGEAFAKMAGDAWDVINSAGREAAEKAGMKITVAPDVVVEKMQEMNAVFEEEYSDSVKDRGLDGAAVLEFYHAQVTDLEAK